MDILEKLNTYLNESTKEPVVECVLTSIDNILSSNDDETTKLEKIAKLMADRPKAEQ